MMPKTGSRRRLWRYAARGLVVVAALVGVLTVRPLRNTVGFFLPKMWLDVSTLDLLAMDRHIRSHVPFPRFPQCHHSGGGGAGGGGGTTDPLAKRFRNASSASSSSLGSLEQPYRDEDMVTYIKALIAERSKANVDESRLMPDAGNHFVLHPDHVEKEVKALSGVASAAAEHTAQVWRHAEGWLAKSKERQERYERYSPALKPREMGEMVRLLALVDLACRAAGLRYFLPAGTLIGQYRHRGFIPWDDDVDIVFDFQQLELAWKVLSCLPGYDIVVISEDNTQWKVYPQTGQLLPDNKRVVRFPFLDVFFVTWDERYMWSLTHFAFCSDLLFKVWDVLPLTPATFEGIRVMFPARKRTVLDSMYTVSDCVSGKYDHRKQRGESNLVIPCTELRDMYTMFHIDE